MNWNGENGYTERADTGCSWQIIIIIIITSYTNSKLLILDSLFAKPFDPSTSNRNLFLVFLVAIAFYGHSWDSAIRFGGNGKITIQRTDMQQVVELNGYVIIVVEGRDNKIKLYGSPADKDNLEVADEILDVNERKLEDLPRAEVIRYIHEVRSLAPTSTVAYLNSTLPTH